ncbi:MAG TPA: ABC-2 transporter permease [Clostridia bacterium]|nr:ABC-2 transporter permease [Clostridia bacterium]
MKGLLLKDILTLKSYARTISILVVVYLVAGITWDNVYFCAGMSGILCAMMVISSFSYDNYAKWDKYGTSLPVTRSDMVGAKYLLALIMTGVGVVITCLLYAVFMLVSKGDFSELLPIIFGTTGAALFLVMVLLPCIYKFGAEKARMAMVIIGVLITLILSLLAWLLPEDMNITAVKVLLFAALPIMEALGFYISYKLSCRIYQGKEL